MNDRSEIHNLIEQGTGTMREADFGDIADSLNKPGIADTNSLGVAIENVVSRIMVANLETEEVSAIAQLAGSFNRKGTAKVVRALEGSDTSVAKTATGNAKMAEKNGKELAKETEELATQADELLVTALALKSRLALYRESLERAGKLAAKSAEHSAAAIKGAEEYRDKYLG